MVKSMRLNFLGKAALNTLLCGMLVVATIAAPQQASAASGEQTVQRIRKEVAANPSNGPTILKNRLGELSETERTKYAASALAAALETPSADYRGGPRRDCDRVMRLYRVVVATSPRSAVALLDVAYRACPERLSAFRDIALQEARAAGLTTVAAAIIAHSNALAAGGSDYKDYKDYKTFKDMREPEDRGLRDYFARAGLFGPLGFTINPANVGGPEGFEKVKPPAVKPPEVSPSE